MGAKIELYGLSLPEIKPGDDLAGLIIEAAQREAGGLQDGDIVVVASKIVSKAYSLLVRLDKVKPSRRAVELARKTGVNPHFIQAVLDNSDEILFILPIKKLAREGLVDIGRVSVDPARAYKLLDENPCIFFVEKRGQIYSDAGLDSSNHPQGVYSFPPSDPDMAAREIRSQIMKRTGKRVAVIISDTEFTPFLGSLDIARGASGIRVATRRFGELDRYGKPKFGGVDLVAHEIAAAAALLMGQTSEGIPVVIVRGYKYEEAEEGVAEYTIKPSQLKRIVRETIKHTVHVLGVKWLTRLLLH